MDASATGSYISHLLHPSLTMPKSLAFSPHSIFRLSPCPCTNPNNLHLHPQRTFFSGSSSNRFTSSSLAITHCSKKPKLSDEETTSTDPEPNPDPRLSLITQQDDPQNLNSGGTSLSSSSVTPSSVNSHGLVFGLGDLSSWDGGAVGSPVVKRFLSDEEERWYMWYHGSSSSSSSEEMMSKDLVGLAVSSNGIHWQRGDGVVNSANDVGSVLNVSEDWWALDTHSIRPAEVVVMSSSKIRGSSAVYWLYYTGYSNTEYSSGLSEVMKSESSRRNLFGDQVKVMGDTGSVCKSLPGLAMSQDGRHWARIEGEHHSGALLDVGSETEWDSTFIASPQVVFHQQGDLRMYYHSYDAKSSHFAIGVARSRDGINWIKLGKVLGAGLADSFDKLGVMNASVVKKRDGTYMMAYEGVSARGGRSVGLASSQDGLKGWNRVGEQEVLEAADGESWDNAGVGTPCLVQMEGDESEWRLYYRGVGKDGKSGIGMAVSAPGGQLGKFERWKGFQL